MEKLDLSTIDRVNLNLIGNEIESRSTSVLFEVNDFETQHQWISLVEDILKDNPTLEEHTVICDDTNNTLEVKEACKFVGDVYLKFKGAERFIQLNFEAVQTGIKFEEIVGK